YGARLRAQRPERELAEHSRFAGPDATEGRAFSVGQRCGVARARPEAKAVDPGQAAVRADGEAGAGLIVGAPRAHALLGQTHPVAVACVTRAVRHAISKRVGACPEVRPQALQE